MAIGPSAIRSAKVDPSTSSRTNAHTSPYCSRPWMMLMWG